MARLVRFVVEECLDELWVSEDGTVTIDCPVKFSAVSDTSTNANGDLHVDLVAKVITIDIDAQTVTYRHGGSRHTAKVGETVRLREEVRLNMPHVKGRLVVEHDLLFAAVEDRPYLRHTAS